MADNCTDRTAEAAEANGARVYRRFDRSRIGKGYALHDLLDWIRRGDGLEQYDAFLIFDADNLLCPDYISKINRTYSDGFEAFHGYRNTKNFGDSWISSAYALWYLHDSVHLNAARMMLGTTCAVTGTGFGFTRALLERIDGWSFFTLTEDVEFDNWCAVNGVRIGFCREAMLYDEQASTFAQSWKQRIRWTQGGLQVSLLYAGRQLRGMLRGGRTGWASFEAATLSLGGYLLSALSGLSVAVTGLAQSGLRGLLAAVGCAVGGLYMGMAVIGALVLLTEMVLSKVEYRILAHVPEVTLYVEYNRKQFLEDAMQLFRRFGLKLQDIEITRAIGEDTYSACVIFTLRLSSKCNAEKLIERIWQVEGVVSVQEL